YRRLRKYFVQYDVQCLRGGQISTEGFLNNYSCILRTAGLAQSLDHGGEHAGWHCQVVQRTFCIVQRGFESIVSCRVLIVGIDVLKQTRQLGKSVRVDTAVVLKA